MSECLRWRFTPGVEMVVRSDEMIVGVRVEFSYAERIRYCIASEAN